MLGCGVWEVGGGCGLSLDCSYHEIRFDHGIGVRFRSVLGLSPLITKRVATSLADTSISSSKDYTLLLCSIRKLHCKLLITMHSQQNLHKFKECSGLQNFRLLTQTLQQNLTSILLLQSASIQLRQSDPSSHDDRYAFIQLLVFYQTHIRAF